MTRSHMEWPSRRGLSFTGWKGYAEAAAATGVCTLVSWLLHPRLASASLGLIFLAGVLVAALRGGVGPALLASIASFLMFNLLFTEPQFTFYVMHRQDVLTLTIFLLVAVVTGQLAARVRNQLEAIRRSNRRISLLEAFSRRLAGIVDQEDFALVFTEYLESVLGVRSIVVKRGYDGKLVVVAGDAGRSGLTDSEAAAAEWAFERRESAGCGTTAFADSYWLFVPIHGKEGSMAVLGVATRTHGGHLDPEQQRILFAMRDQAAIALERLLLTAEMERNRLLLETDKLRSALLSSISHDLRTPLVSIKGTASALLELDGALSPADTRELLENLLAEGERLNRHVQNLLEMTRLGYGTVKPHLDWSDVRDIAAAAVRGLKRSLGSRSVQVSVAPGSELVHTDSHLLEQVLVNLIENAAKYSPGGSAIRIEAGRDRDRYTLSVCDPGPGIPAAERDRVFDMFHRASVTDQRTSGTGMGLAICKGLVEALGGRIRALPWKEETGTRIEMRLPQPREMPAAAGAED